MWVKYILSLMLIHIYTSCSDKINDPIVHFNKREEQKIKPSRIIQLKDYEILKPADAIQVGNNYFIYDTQVKNMFNFVDLLSRSMIKGGERGSGPHDVGMPGSF